MRTASRYHLSHVITKLVTPTFCDYMPSCICSHKLIQEKTKKSREKIRQLIFNEIVLQLATYLTYYWATEDTFCPQTKHCKDSSHTYPVVLTPITFGCLLWRNELPVAMYCI